MLTHIDHTIPKDVDVVARGSTTIIEVSYLDKAIRSDDCASAVFTNQLVPVFLHCVRDFGGVNVSKTQMIGAKFSPSLLKIS